MGVLATFEVTCENKTIGSNGSNTFNLFLSKNTVKYLLKDNEDEIDTEIKPRINLDNLKIDLSLIVGEGAITLKDLKKGEFILPRQKKFISDSIEIELDGDKIIDIKNINKETKLFKKEINMKTFDNIPIRISVEVGSVTKTLKELNEFGVGDTLKLDSKVADVAKIYANEKYIGTGEVMAMEDNIAVRITELINDTPENCE
jgi:flagellar motor switch protein FliN/FliY